MANYCDGAITITGEKAELESLLKKLGYKGEIKSSDYHLDFEFKPEEVLPIENNWTNSSRLWGSRYIMLEHCVYDYELSESTGILSLVVTTAWGPALEFFQYLSMLFVELDFKYQYFEPGGLIAGEYKVSAGEGSDNYIDYDNNREEWLSYVEEHFDESIRNYH